MLVEAYNIFKNQLELDIILVNSLYSLEVLGGGCSDLQIVIGSDEFIQPLSE